MAKPEESKDFIKQMVTTGIKGTLWPSKTYLIAVIKNRNKEVICKKTYETLPKKDESNKHHTERQMLDDQEFEECLHKGEVGEIILTSNYSPCKDCIKDLKTFYEECTELKLTIRFSHPYETKQERTVHLEGLKDLDRAGITLEAMSEKSWFDFLEFMFDLDPGAVRKRDHTTRDRLAEFLRSDTEAEEIGGKIERLRFNESDSDDKSTVNDKEPK